jgi:hypothetical protein
LSIKEPSGGIVRANLYTDAFLRMLRNRVKIDKVIDVLMLETRNGTGIPVIKSKGDAE